MKRSILLFLTQTASKIPYISWLWVLILLGCYFMSSPAYSQDVFWGLAPNSGPGNAGTAFSLKSSGTDFTLHHAFYVDPISPVSVVEGSNGSLYGVTSQGGSANSGTLFKINRNGTGFTVLKNFDPAIDGAIPVGSLLESSKGSFYGLTKSGGLTNSGTLYKINADGSEFTVLKNFDPATDGVNPTGSLTKGSDGSLYGMTSQGGATNSGTLFKIDPDGTNFTLLKSFDFSEGVNPVGSLLETSNGKFYGLTSQGGLSGSGIIYKINADGTDFSILKSFDPITEGSTPLGSLIQDSEGNFYGTTSQGGKYGFGTIFKLDANETAFIVLKSFDSTADGANPSGSLLQEKEGSLYGLTKSGGSANGGTLFKINADGTGFTLLKSFDSATDGANPYGNLLPASDGYFYGVTNTGENTGTGTLFRLKAEGTDFTTLKKFYLTDGAAPYGAFVEGSNGAFYGITLVGGTANSGTLFKINRDGTGFTLLKSFDPSIDGANPAGGLIRGEDGTLYGMTSQGGKYGFGTIFKFDVESTDFTVLKHFNQATDGTNPYGNLILASNGYLYGMTSQGGSANSGLIFRSRVDGTEFTILKSFIPDTDGANPMGSLCQGNDGHLYGMASQGGSANSGTLFKINADGTEFTVLKSFDPTMDGANPYGSLIKGNEGSLYGMTNLGGENNSGTIFKLDPDGTNFTLLVSFNYFDGTNPSGNLVAGNEGSLYGMTTQGGDYGFGTIFKLDTEGEGLTLLKSFDPATDGGNPAGSLIIQKDTVNPSPEAIKVNFQTKWATPPQGWIKEYGLPFGEKTTSEKPLVFGWKRRDNNAPINLSVGSSFPGNPGNGRHRPSPSDILLSTLMHMQGNDIKNFRGLPVESYWEMAVKNGDYQVTVSVGDGMSYTHTDPESHSLNVEGKPAITHFVPKGASGSVTRFKQATIKVKVTDGYLTINADGGTNTKINYAIIEPLFSMNASAEKEFSFHNETNTIDSIQAFPNPFTDKLTLNVKEWQGNLTISLQDIRGNLVYQTQIQVETELFHLNLAPIPMRPGVYLIRISDANAKSKVSKIIKK